MAGTVTNPVDRTNRTLLVLLGALLLLLGLVGLALSFGAFGRERADGPVLSAGLSTFIGGSPWYWWAVAAVAVVVGLLLLRWLVGQLSTTRLSELQVEPDRRDGETVLRAGALADGVEEEVEGIAGVRGAALRLDGTPSEHRHHLTVVLDERGDVDAVRRQLVQRTVPNIRRALDFEEPALDVRLVLAPRQRRRIR